jgi:hypothetical protein
MRLDLRARGRANEHVTVFAHERQPGAYHSHMVGRERLWTNADVDSTIGAAPDFVRSMLPGQGLKGIVEAEPPRIPVTVRSYGVRGSTPLLGAEFCYSCA